MTCYEALAAVPDLILIHVGTFEVADDEVQEQRKQFWVNLEERDREKLACEVGAPQESLTAGEQVEDVIQGMGHRTGHQKPLVKKAKDPSKKGAVGPGKVGAEDSDSDYEDGHRLIESSICRTKCLSMDETLEPFRRFWVEMRPKQSQKVSLKLYRTESKKIIEVLQRFSDQVEKASCDEAYLDVTTQVQVRHKFTRQGAYDEQWDASRFMGFEKGEGRFLPETEKDQRMWLANRIAAEVRKAVYDELGYTASAGISHNKTVAKIACTYNKPNGQTVVPERYVKQALAGVPIKNIRWLGGKLGQQLRDAGLHTMGDIQPLDVELEIVPIIGYEKA